MALTGAAVACLYLLALAFPEPLFAYSLTRENFRVYSRHPVDPSVREILDDVNRRLSRSEINVVALTHRVFILETPAWNSFFNGPYRAAMGRNCEIGNAIFIPRLDVRSGRIVHFDGRSAEASILAHECVHTLVQRRLGLMRMWRLPFWKKEGYAQYIGVDEARSEPEPEPYRRARLRWKALLETEGLSFDQVMQSKCGASVALAARGKRVGGGVASAAGPDARSRDESDPGAPMPFRAPPGSYGGEGGSAAPGSACMTKRFTAEGGEGATSWRP